MKLVSQTLREESEEVGRKILLREVVSYCPKEPTGARSVQRPPYGEMQHAPETGSHALVGWTQNERRDQTTKGELR